MKSNITVCRPASTDVVDTGIYDRQTGKPIGYVVRSEKTSVEVEITPAAFLDAASGMLGSSVSYRTKNGTIHQNPVYHHKIDARGSIVLSYKDNTTVWNDLTLDFGVRKKSYPYPPEHPQENKISTQSVSIPFSSLDVYRSGYRKVATVVAGILHLYVGAFYVPDKQCYQISTYGHDLAIIAKDDLGYFRAEGVGSIILPSFETVISKFNVELRDGYPGIDALYERVREYLRLRISVATKPIERLQTADTRLPSSELPSDELIIDWAQSVVPKFTVSDYTSFHGNIPWSELAADAYQNIGYADNNGIAYLKEATELRKQTLQYAQTLRSVASSKGTKRAKALAAAYLGIHYGYKLTLMDTANYIKTLRKNRSKDRIQRCASTRSTVTSDNWSITARYQVYYRTKDWGNPQTEIVNNFLQQVDLLPTPENIWDMVPYSFVIDWFTGIGKTLTSVGNAGVLQMYNEVLCRIQSTKATRELSLALPPTEQISYDGTFVESIYERTVSPYPLAPNPYSSLEPASPLQHTVEGAALVVQKVVK